MKGTNRDCLTDDKKYYTFLLPSGSFYTLSVSEIVTHQRLLDVLLPLLDKNWMTNLKLDKFIRTVCHSNNIYLYGRQ